MHHCGHFFGEFNRFRLAIAAAFPLFHGTITGTETGFEGTILVRQSGFTVQYTEKESDPAVVTF